MKKEERKSIENLQSEKTKTDNVKGGGGGGKRNITPLQHIEHDGSKITPEVDPMKPARSKNEKLNDRMFGK